MGSVRIKGWTITSWCQGRRWDSKPEKLSAGNAWADCSSIIIANRKTFRFASTAPFFVEIGPNKQHISKASAQFFLDWTRDRMQRIQVDDADKCKEVLQHHLRAEKYW